MEVVAAIKSIFYFILAGLCEIGGGYLVWLWLREGKSLWCGLIGAAVLVLYGVVPTLQPAGFGRVYAAYGGVFIALSILWGWKIDHIAPDRFDIIGGLVALTGAGIIMYWPREAENGLEKGQLHGHEGCRPKFGKEDERIGFLDASGREKRDLRLVDYLPPDQLLGRMAALEKGGS